MTPNLFRKGAPLPVPSLFLVKERTCPTPVERVDQETGEVYLAMAYNRWTKTLYPRPCGGTNCPVCGPSKGRGAAKALWLANPSHAIGFTQVGSTWTTTGRQIRKAFAYVREHIPTLRWAYSLEDNPMGTGSHAHGYIYWSGNDIPLSTLRRWFMEGACRAHLGQEVFVDALDDESRVRFHAYPMKSLADPDRRGGFLDLNGQHIIHTSKGFWRDGRTGEHLRTRRRAIARANAVIYGEMKNRGALV